MRYNVASVSARVRRESWRERKRGMIFLFCAVLFCLFGFFFFCFRSNFRAITRFETRVTHTMESTIPGRIVNTSEKEYRYNVTAIANNREAEKCLRGLRANSELVKSRTSLEAQLPENFDWNVSCLVLYILINVHMLKQDYF